MANMADNSIQVFGGRRAIAEFILLLQEQLLMEFTDIHLQGESSVHVGLPMGLLDGPLLNTQGAFDRRPAPLQRDVMLAPDSYLPEPLRYSGGHESHWAMPYRTGLYGFGPHHAGLCELGPGADGKAVFCLSFHLSSKWSPLTALLAELSRRVPGAIIVNQYEQSGDGILGGSAYLDGKRIAHYDHDNAPAADEPAGDSEEDDSEDETDDDDGESRSTRVGKAEIQARVTSPAEKAALASVGDSLRTWSHLAASAYCGGLEGLRAALDADITECGYAAALDEDLARAMRCGGMSWLDGLIYGSSTAHQVVKAVSDEVAPSAESFPGNFNLLSAEPDGAQAVLREIASGSALGRVLLEVVSARKTRLMSGIHPVAILAEAAKQFATGELHDGFKLVAEAMKSKLGPLPDAVLLGREWLRTGNGKEEPHVAMLRLVASSHLSGINTANELTELLVTEDPKVGKLIALSLGCTMAQLLDSLEAGKLPPSIGQRLNPDYVFDLESDALVRSLWHVAMQGTVPATELALKAGFDPLFVFRSQLAQCPRGAMEVFTAVFGPDKLPDGIEQDLVGFCEKVGDAETVARFNSMKTESLMRVALDAARSTSAASAPTAPESRSSGAPRRRRSL